MSSSGLSIVRSLACRSVALVRPYAPPPLPPLPGPVRWSSTDAGRLALHDAGPLPPHSDGPSQELGRRVQDKDRGRQKDRARWISRLLSSSQVGIEETQGWRYLDARYVGLRRGQVSLLAVLTEAIERANRAGERLTAREVFQAHLSVLRWARNVGPGVQMASTTGGEERDQTGMRYERSSVTFSVMLKYAYQLRDASALRSIAKEALSWKHAQARARPLEKRTVRFLHPRMAAADDLSRLARNLFLSLAVKHRQRASREKETYLPGKALPSSDARVMRGDDAIALSVLLQNRLGAIKVAKKRGESGEEYLKLSRAAQAARYPLTHQSRRVRWINRQAERGFLPEQVAQAGRISPLQLPQPGGSGSESTGVDAGKGSHAKRSKGEGGEMMRLLQSTGKGGLENPNVVLLIKGYEAWQDELAARLQSRKEVGLVLKQFRFKPHLGPLEQVEAVSQVVPTWLILSALRTQIYAGNGVKAERLVELYLKSLEKVHEDRRLEEVIPIHQARVHAITDPFRPPTGASLLNGILRAHETSGASDCYEKMLVVVEQWCVDGKGLCTAIHHRKTHVTPVQPGACLVPSATTVHILLQALRNRRRRVPLAILTIEQVWKRWAHIPLIDRERERRHHQTLAFPLRVFATLLDWAAREKRQERVERVLSLEREWRARGSDGAGWAEASVADKTAWDKAVCRAGAGKDDLKKRQSDLP